MKILKHFIDKSIGIVVAITCKHKDTRESSCPFTMRDYTICKKCGQIIKQKETDV